MTLNDDIDRNWQVRIEKDRLERAAHYRRRERERRNTEALISVSIAGLLVALLALAYIAK